MTTFLNMQEAGMADDEAWVTSAAPILSCMLYMDASGTCCVIASGLLGAYDVLRHSIELAEVQLGLAPGRGADFATLLEKVMSKHSANAYLIFYSEYSDERI